MVLVHRAFGYRFVIYTLDHEPAHLHITGAGLAKINLAGDAPGVVYSIGIKRPDMRRLMREVADNKEHFLKQWERIHGPERH